MIWVLGALLVLSLLVNVRLFYILGCRRVPDGSIDITETPEGKKVFSLNLDDTPDYLEDKQQIVFQVNTHKD